jgi:hypothetical protein
MKRIILGFLGMSILAFTGCQDNPTDGNNNPDMSANDEAIMSIIETDSTDMLYTAIDDESEDNFGNDANWMGDAPKDKFSFRKFRFGRIGTKPTERNVEIIYDTDSTATAHIHTKFEGRFVTILPEPSGDTLIFVRHVKPLVQEIERIVHLWKFRDLPNRRLNWKIKNISMAEGKSVENSVEIMKVEVYPQDQDEVEISDPLEYWQNGVNLFTFPRWTEVRMVVTVRNTSPNPVIFPENTESTELVRLHYGRNRHGHHGRTVLNWIGKDENGDNMYEGIWTVKQFSGYHHSVIDVIDNGTILRSDPDEYPYNSNTWSTPYRVTRF